ncbi:MAG: YHS domain-containing (seleno)protein [Planctomycetota bacterium]
MFHARCDRFFPAFAAAGVLTAATVVPISSVSAEPDSDAADQRHDQDVSPARHTLRLGLHGYSPVSYFRYDAPHAGSPEFSAQVEGVTYFLANQDELDAFNADPQAFLPAYGGWCATGAALEQYFPVDPTNYKIVDGRLLLFLKNDEVDALELWNQGDEAEQLAKADAFYAAEHGN